MELKGPINRGLKEGGPVQGAPVQGGPVQGGPQGVRLFFKNFRDGRIRQKTVEMCGLMGQHGDLHLLVDHFLGEFHKGQLYRKQAAFCINYVLLGVRNGKRIY